MTPAEAEAAFIALWPQGLTTTVDADRPPNRSDEGGGDMDPKQSLAAIVINLTWLSLAGLSQAAWMDPERPVDNLKLMTIPELVTEAWQICSKTVVDLKNADMFGETGRKFRDVKSLNDASQLMDQAARRRRYLERIGLVLRDKNHGEMPDWFKQFNKASYGRDEAECDKAAIAGGWCPKQ
jgi:hypothetical protein